MDPVTVLLWAGVVLAAVVVAGAASGIWDNARKTRAEASRKVAAAHRATAEDQQATAYALLERDRFEAQRARFAARRNPES